MVQMNSIGLDEGHTTLPTNKINAVFLPWFDAPFDIFDNYLSALGACGQP